MFSHSEQRKWLEDSWQSDRPYRGKDDGFNHLALLRILEEGVQRFTIKIECLRCSVAARFDPFSQKRMGNLVKFVLLKKGHELVNGYLPPSVGGGPSGSA